MHPTHYFQHTVTLRDWFDPSLFFLASTLQATLDVCEDDWDTVGFPTEEEEIFCQASPWSFEVPLYASWIAIAHVRAGPGRGLFVPSSIPLSGSVTASFFALSPENEGRR